MNTDCPTWCAESHDSPEEQGREQDIMHTAKPAFAGWPSVCVTVRAWDAETPRVRVHTAAPETAKTQLEPSGAWLDAPTARVVAQVLDNLPKLADRRVISAALRNAAAQAEGMEAGS